jgi:hypothetical protein
MILGILAGINGSIYISLLKLCTILYLSLNTRVLKVKVFFKVSKGFWLRSPFQGISLQGTVEFAFAHKVTSSPSETYALIRISTILSIPPYRPGGTGNSGSTVTKIFIKLIPNGLILV